MSSTLVITVVVVAAVGWLAFLAVSALRSRGPEEIPANLAPGATDDQLETRRVERFQQAAVLLSAVLAVGLPLYYLGETSRQEGFVSQFDEESIHRGEELVAEYGCYGCHGPEGVGGVASYVEKRTGVTVSWAAPSINDVFFRYGRDEVRYWLTYGRGNTPMPAWGLAGGGPMNEQQIEDIVNYLETIQIPQSEAAAEVETVVDEELRRLEGADAAMAAAIVDQEQVIAELERAPELAPVATDLAEEAAAIVDGASQGLDTDGDGLADDAEVALSELTLRARDAFLLPGLAPIELDPANPTTNDGIPDLEFVQQALANMEELVASKRAPILASTVDAIREALADTGEDGDGDGISDTAEAQIVARFADAVNTVLPSELVVVELDPTNPESRGGVSDLETARTVVSGLHTLELNLNIQSDNNEKLLAPAREALDNLFAAQRDKAWEFDFQGIADHAFDGDVERAKRVVGLFNGYCARCHTSGYSAGVAFEQEAGSGGFAPALWDGRPAVQFLSDDDLVSFLIVGAEANKPYGVNGFGNGQMPGWGEILSNEDLADLAHWLRAGDLTGKGDG